MERGAQIKSGSIVTTPKLTDSHVDPKHESNDCSHVHPGLRIYHNAVARLCQLHVKLSYLKAMIAKMKKHPSVSSATKRTGDSSPLSQSNTYLDGALFTAGIKLTRCSSTCAV